VDPLPTLKTLGSSCPWHQLGGGKRGGPTGGTVCRFASSRSFADNVGYLDAGRASFSPKAEAKGPKGADVFLVRQHKRSIGWRASSTSPGRSSRSRKNFPRCWSNSPRTAQRRTARADDRKSHLRVDPDHRDDQGGYRSEVDPLVERLGVDGGGCFVHELVGLERRLYLLAFDRA
jgi:hypothetical protein